MKQQKEEVNKYDKIGEDSSIHTEDEILKFLKYLEELNSDLQYGKITLLEYINEIVKK